MLCDLLIIVVDVDLEFVVDGWCDVVWMFFDVVC